MAEFMDEAELDEYGPARPSSSSSGIALTCTASRTVMAPTEANVASHSRHRSGTPELGISPPPQSPQRASHAAPPLITSDPKPMDALTRARLEKQAEEIFNSEFFKSREFVKFTPIARYKPKDPFAKRHVDLLEEVHGVLADVKEEKLNGPREIVMDGTASYYLAKIEQWSNIVELVDLTRYHWTKASFMDQLALCLNHFFDRGLDAEAIDLGYQAKRSFDYKPELAAFLPTWDRR